MDTSCSLTDQKCVPCEGGVPPLTPEEYSVYLPQIKSWEVIEEKKIKKSVQLKDFEQVLEIVNKIGAIAQEQGHHPDLYVHDWNKLDILTWTHAIGGLSINDFILAAKIDELF